MPEDELTEEQNNFLRKDMTYKNFRFGMHLRSMGLVSGNDIVEARILQKKQNRLIGERAIAKGWLYEGDVERILVLQEETVQKFGEIAVAHGYLQQEQVDSLIGEVDDNFIFFGEALVQLGKFDKNTMLDHLRNYNLIKFKDVKQKTQP